MKNIPNKIYLNLGLQEGSADIDFDELSEVTWSKDKVDADDIEYVRKEPVDWEARRFELIKEVSYLTPNARLHLMSLLIAALALQMQ